MNNINKIVLLAGLISAMPQESSAQVNILLGTGLTACFIPLRDSTALSKRTNYRACDFFNLNLPFQIEHHFGSCLHGLNIHITNAIFVTNIAVGYFFGGVISKSETRTWCMKGGLNIAGGLFVGKNADDKFASNFHWCLNPYIEFALHAGNLIHAFEIGGMIWAKTLPLKTNNVDQVYLSFLGHAINPSIKYKIMIRLLK